MKALQVKYSDRDFCVNLKFPRAICSKYFKGMDSKQMASIVEQALAARFEGKEARGCLMQRTWNLWI